MVNKSNIGELTIEQKDFKISIHQKEEQITQVVAAPQQFPALPMAVPPAQLAPVAPAIAPAAPAAHTEKPKPAAPTANTTLIKSPMIGTFYRRPAPDKPNYVEEGNIITPGKVICVIEAMKLFNEIESEISGKIVKVLVEDASPVEFDQPLFEVEA